MDDYTIRGLREEAAAAGRPPKPLVSLRPQDSLHAVIGKLFRNRCSMAPVLSAGDGGARRAGLLRGLSLCLVGRRLAGLLAGTLAGRAWWPRLARRASPGRPNSCRESKLFASCGGSLWPLSGADVCRVLGAGLPPPGKLDSVPRRPLCTSTGRLQRPLTPLRGRAGRAGRRPQRRAPPRRQAGAAPPGAGLTGAGARGGRRRRRGGHAAAHRDHQRRARVPHAPLPRQPGLAAAAGPADRRAAGGHLVARLAARGRRAGRQRRAARR